MVEESSEWFKWTCGLLVGVWLQGIDGTRLEDDEYLMRIGAQAKGEE